LLLFAGAAGGAVAWTNYIWPNVARALAPEPKFAPIAKLPGYRRLVSAGSNSRAAWDPLVGLEANTSPERDGLPNPRAPVDPCAALYGPELAGAVPLVVFTDFNCPYCRTLDRQLFDLVAPHAAEVSLKTQHLPLLGRSSVWAARGALAADRQNAYDAFHKRLMRAAFSIGPDYLEQVAIDLNLDKDKLMRDATGAAVTQRIAEARWLAARLGIVGTPGLLVRRTLVSGSVSPDLLEKLIRIEANQRVRPNCAAFT
jgi:predicted DsbA family dithiol-disulfide isomerase